MYVINVTDIGKEVCSNLLRKQIEFSFLFSCMTILSTSSAHIPYNLKTTRKYNINHCGGFFASFASQFGSGY